MINRMRAAGFSLLACLLLSPHGSASAEPVDLKTFDYVESGQFLSKKDFQAQKFVDALASLPALQKENPSRYAAIADSLRKKYPAGAERLLRYFARYQTNSCKANHVRMNLDLKDFEEFYSKTVTTADKFESACADLKAGKNSEAIKNLSAAIQGDPRYSEAYAHRSLARWRLKDYPESMGDYLEGTKVPMGTPAEQRKDCVCSPNLAGDFNLLHRSIERSQKWKDQGVSLYSKGDMKGSVAALDQAIKMFPGDPEAYLSRSAARKSLGNAQGSIEDLDRAIDLAIASRQWDFAARAMQDSLEGWVSRKKTGNVVADLEKLAQMAPPDWSLRKEILNKIKTMRSETQKKNNSGPPEKHPSKSWF